MTDESASLSLSMVQELAEAVRANIARVIVGKLDVIDLLLVALLSDGHVLLEDVPGMGKTVMAKALARSLGATFQRVQGTPDLEAMGERQVTVERETLPLPRPYLVLATQNPIELEGTFPLPEAQLDRFLLRVRVGYPAEDEEEAILHRFKNDEPLETLQPMVSAEQVVALQQMIRQVQWQPEVERYLLAIVRATRQHPAVNLGVSPRGTLALYRACEAYAAMQGRDYVEPDDVKRLAPSVLAHRLLTTTRARLRGSASEAIIAEVVEATPVPVETIALPNKR